MGLGGVDGVAACCSSTGADIPLPSMPPSAGGGRPTTAYRPSPYVGSTVSAPSLRRNSGTVSAGLTTRLSRGVAVLHGIVRHGADMPLLGGWMMTGSKRTCSALTNLCNFRNRQVNSLDIPVNDVFK